MARKQYDDDDGRRIADMNVDGMPWYDGRARRAFGVGGKRADSSEMQQDGERPEPLTKRETRRLIANAMLAALLIGAVFAAAGALFILFCTKIWFGK